MRLHYGQDPKLSTFHVSALENKEKSGVIHELLHVRNSQLNLFDNNVLRFNNRHEKFPKLLKLVRNFARKKSSSEIIIERHKIKWKYRRSPYFYQKKISSDLSGMGLLIGLNRETNSNDRPGSGLCKVLITLLENKDNSCASGKVTCHRDGECVKGRRSHRCVCKSGFYGSGIRCKDLNECKRNNGGCSQICINTRGNYTCRCYGGFNLRTDGHECVDRNECLLKNGKCERGCTNSVGSYQCVCGKEYSLNSDGLTCSWSWCQRTLGCNHHCQYTSRGTHCACRKGYRLHHDKKLCIRKCSLGNGGCQQICEDKLNGPSCKCFKNYRLHKDNSTCIVTCRIHNGGCSNHCQDTLNGPVCSCPSGYLLASDKKLCQDVNECSLNNGGCNHTCINLKGSYECACHPGYRFQTDGKNCVDKNECLVKSTCEHGCTNLPGSYKCYCRHGYQIYGISHCADIDECSYNNGGCQFQCINTPGSYECSCPAGYRQLPNKKDCDKARKCLPLQAPSKTIMKCSRIYSSESCQLECIRGAHFIMYNHKTLHYHCGPNTKYFWVGEVNSVLPSCSEMISLPHMKRKARFNFKTNHCTMHEKNKSLFNRSLINNFLDRKRYQCYGDCRLKDIHVMCQRNTRRSRRRGKKVARRILTTNSKNTVVAEFDLEVNPITVSEKCNFECAKKKTRRKMKRTTQKMRRHIRKNEFLISWDNTRLKVNKRSFRALRIQLTCPVGQVLVTDKCVSCSEGSFYDMKNRTCMPCPSGTYQNIEGQTSCIPCPTLKVSSGIMGAQYISECQAHCSPGYYSEDGYKPCVPCDKGFYQPDFGRTGCLKCGDNIDTSGLAAVGFNQCIVAEFCDSGHFYDDKSHKCKPCSKGTYQPNKGENFCVSCPGNTSTDFVGTSDSSECKDHQCRHVRVNKYRGYIMTPNYPGQYPTNIDCEWQIRSSKRRRILILIPEIHLSDADNCGDVVLVDKKSRKYPYLRQLYKKCRTDSQAKAFTTRSKYLVIKFKTNNRNSSHGFRIHYVSYDKVYHGLIESVVNDDRLYQSYQHQSILKDDALLAALLDLIAVPTTYFKYAHVVQDIFPESFVQFLKYKISRLHFP